MLKKWIRFSDISLKTQLIASFLAVTLLVLSISTYYNYQKTLRILEKRTEQTTLTEFRQIETNVLTLLHEVDKVSKTFLYENEVQTFLQRERLSNVEFLPYEREITSGLISKYLSNYDYLDSIYIFTENGMTIGGTPLQNQSSTVIGRDYPFYRTTLYQIVKERYPEPTWSGGLRTSDFMRLPVAHLSHDQNVLSMMRAYKPTGRSDIAAELVLNVEERYVFSIYGSLQTSPDGPISIVDGEGTVISSTLEDSIREPYLFAEQIAGRSGFGSFTAMRDHEEEQVLYYRMDETGWMLVHEVPTELYRNDFVAIGRFSAGVFVLSVLLIILISSLWMNRIMASLQHLIKGMRTVGSGHVGLTLPRASNREIGHLISQFNKMSTGIRDLMRKNEEAEEEKRKLEIEALQAQINPHFLFNTLNTVKWMAEMAGTPNIADCVTNLGSMLRPIYYQPALLWSIGDEIGFLRHYVAIMSYRYGEDVAFVFDIEEDVMDCLTLRFILQPLIENTLVHGDRRRGTVRVTAATAGDDVVFAVTDENGGMPAARAEEMNAAFRLPSDQLPAGKPGIGLLNVNKRIRLHFGERYGIRIDSKEGVGTEVRVTIPALRAEVQKT